MLRIDKDFKNKLIKLTIILSIALEVIMVVINFPDIKEIIQYCGMGAVIIAFVIIQEVRGIAFGLKYGLIHYTSDAIKEEQVHLESAEEVLIKQIEKINSDTK